MLSAKLQCQPDAQFQLKIDTFYILSSSFCPKQICLPFFYQSNFLKNSSRVFCHLSDNTK